MNTKLTPAQMRVGQFRINAGTIRGQARELGEIKRAIRMLLICVDARLSVPADLIEKLKDLSQ
jgi:hypothetical protein